MFSHGSTPSTPHGARRRRSEGEREDTLEPVLDEPRSIVTTESPDSHRIIKKSRAGGFTPGSSTPPPHPSSSTLPPLPLQDTPVLPPASQEAQTPLAPASPFTQLNALLTQALLLAVETVTPSTGHSEQFARSQQLVRTIASHFNVTLRSTEVPLDPPPSKSPPTYASAARSAATPPSSRPPARMAKKVNQGQLLSLGHSPRQGSSRVIVRFTSPPPPLNPGMDLSGPFDLLREELGYIGIPIRAVQPTRSGHLVIHTFTEAAAERLRLADAQVYLWLEQALGWQGTFSLESGLRWSSVVVHDVPLRPLLAAPMGRLSIEGYGDKFLELVGKGGNDFGDLSKICARVSALLRWEDVDVEGMEAEGEVEESMRRVSVRLDLMDEEVASRIRQRGVYIGGQYCRVSQYKPRQCRTSMA